MTPKLLSAKEMRKARKALHALGGWRETDLLDAHIAALEADNAALMDQLNATANALDDLDLSGEEETRATIYGQSHALDALSKQPHPGAQLLAEVARLCEHVRFVTEHAVSCATSRLAGEAEHAKALVRARNEGLEKAAQHLTTEAQAHRTMEKQADTSTAEGRHGRMMASERQRVLNEVEEELRAMKESES